MKKGLKYFCIAFAAIIIIGLLVSVGTITLPTINNGDSTDDSTDDSPEVKTTYYPVSTVLNNVTLVSYSSLKVSDNAEAINLNFAAAEGYTLPLDVTVTGCEYMWNNLTGQLFLALGYDNVTVAITAVESSEDDTDTEDIENVIYNITTNLSNTVASTSNVSAITNKDGSAILKFSAYSGYKLPTSISVSGCTYLWNYSTGELILSAPTGNITITIASSVIVYDVRTSLNGVVASSSNSDTIPGSLASANINFYYTAEDGYELPSSITVTGAKYTWSKSTGCLTLTNITGTVYITINGVMKDKTYIIEPGYWYAAGAGNTQKESNAGWLTDLKAAGVTLPCEIWLDDAGEAFDVSSSDINLHSDYNYNFCFGFRFNADGSFTFILTDGDEITAWSDPDDGTDIFLTLSEEDFPDGIEVNANAYKAWMAIFKIDE